MRVLTCARAPWERSRARCRRRGSKPLRLGGPPRQGERLVSPVQRLADRVGPGGDCLADLPPQGPADSGGQAGVVEGGQRLIHLRARGVERADSRQG